MASLPTISSNIPRDLRQFLERVRETIGGRGEDEVVTVRHLIAAGIADYAGGTLSPTDTTGSYGTPPAPTGLAATGALANVLLSWDAPVYRGHAYTEVWAAEEPDGGGVPDLGEALLVGMAPGSIFAHNLGGGATRWYWVKFVNLDGQAGPFNAVEGIQGETGQDPAYLLELLSGEVTESQLANDLSARIDLIDAPDDIVGSVNARIAAIDATLAAEVAAVQTQLTNSVATIQGQINTSNAAIAAEATARAEAITEEASQRADAIAAEAAARVSAITTEEAARTTAILDEATARTAAIAQEAASRATAISQEATAREVLATQLRGSYTGTDAASLTTGLIYSERQSRVTAVDALQTQINLIQAATSGDLSDVLAAVQEEQTARITADSGLASDIDTLTTALTSAETSLSAAIQAEQTARVNADSAEALDREALAVQLRGDYTGTDGAALTTGLLYSERQARITADSSLSTSIATLSANLTSAQASLSAAIESEETARVDAVSAEASARDALAVQLRGSYDGTDGASLTTGLIYNERQARLTADSSLQSQINVLVAASSGDFQAATAAVLEEQEARIAADAVNATSISNVSARLDNLKDKNGNATNKTLEATVEDNRTAQISGDAALSSSITSLSAQLQSDVSDLSALITAEQTARANADTVEATSRNTLATQLRGNYTGTDAAQLSTGLIYSERQSRLTAIDSLQTQINVIQAATSGDLSDVLAAVQEEQTARTNADAAEATERQNLAAQIRGNYTGDDIALVSSGLLHSEREARSTADTALASEITTLSAFVNTKSRVFYQSTEPTGTAQSPLNVGDLWIDTNITYVNDYVEGDYTIRSNRMYRYDGTDWVEAMDYGFADWFSAINSEKTARVDADTALAADITSLTASVNANVATLQGELQTQASEDAALAQSIATLSATVTGNYNTLNSAIQSEASARANADTAISQTVDTLTATVTGNYNTLNAAIQSEATARADADTAISQTVDTLTATVTGNYSTLNSAVQTEASARADADTAISQTVDSLAATVTGNYSTLNSAIQAETTARVSEDSALAQSISALQSTVNSNDTAVNAAISDEATARADADTALSQTISTLSSTVTGNYTTLDAAIQSEATARANADTALSQTISTLQSTVNGNTAAVQTEATARANADNTLFAQYTVKVEANGYVSGFGLASTANNATPTSEFIVRADTFAIASPSGPGIAPAEPFIVRTTATTINGVSVPTGVYIKDAFIQNGSISNAKIGNAAIDDAKIANLSAAKITAGTLDANRIGANTITGDKISTNLLAAKLAQITDAYVGTANIDNGAITNAKIKDADINIAKIDTASINDLSSLSANIGTITAGKMQSSDGKFVIDLNNKLITITV